MQITTLRQCWRRVSPLITSEKFSEVFFALPGAVSPCSENFSERGFPSRRRLVSSGVLSLVSGRAWRSDSGLLPMGNKFTVTAASIIL